jgi:predicted homoserine dehydrogenase-like protein
MGAPEPVGVGIVGAGLMGRELAPCAQLVKGVDAQTEVAGGLLRVEPAVLAGCAVQSLEHARGHHLR